MSLTQEDRDWIRAELEPLKEDVSSLKEGLDRVGDAIQVVAENLPGAVPNQDSHVVRKVRRALGRRPSTTPLAAEGR